LNSAELLFLWLLCSERFFGKLLLLPVLRGFRVLVSITFSGAFDPRSGAEAIFDARAPTVFCCMGLEAMIPHHRV
jgi:hypothetical protein